eukprot:scaffold257648_cov27-Tisochrysis_lutea.AAC.2
MEAAIQFRDSDLTIVVAVAIAWCTQGAASLNAELELVLQRQDEMHEALAELERKVRAQARLRVLPGAKTATLLRRRRCLPSSHSCLRGWADHLVISHTPLQVMQEAGAVSALERPSERQQAYMLAESLDKVHPRLNVATPPARRANTT